MQIISEEDEHSFQLDLFDPTKLVPEESVSVQIVGKMTLNKTQINLWNRQLFQYHLVKKFFRYSTYFTIAGMIKI